MVGSESRALYFAVGGLNYFILIDNIFVKVIL